MSSLPVVFEDCSETDARRVSVFELMRLQKRVKKMEAWGDENAPKFDMLLTIERQHNLNLEHTIKRLTEDNVALSLKMQGMSPKVTLWRAIGLIALGAAFGAGLVLAYPIKAHAQGYRMPDYAAPPPVIQYQPLTPPNSLQQGEPQSFSVIPYGSGQSDGLGQLEGSGGVVVNSDGSTVGSYVVTP